MDGKMKLFTGLLVVFTMWIIPSISNATDDRFSDEVSVEMERMRIRMDSLETRMEHMNIELAQSNPFATGRTLNWGSGWHFSAQLTTRHNVGVEFAYMHQFRNWHAPWEPEYIDRTSGYRIGVAFGYSDFMNEAEMVDDNGEEYMSSGLIPYLKFIYGSPVLLNFISTSGYFKAMMVMPFNSDENIEEEDAQWGLGFGMEVEFWISENKNIFLGFSLEGCAIDFTDDENILLPFEYRPRAGARIFF